MADPTGLAGACFEFGVGCPTVSGNEALQALSTGADYTPVVSDIKGGLEAVANPTPLNVAAAVIGIVPGIGDAISKALKTGGNILENAAKGARAEAQVAEKL